MDGNLTERDHNNMDTFLGQILDDYKNGTLTKEQVVSGLAHIMAALDKGNTGEARVWLEQGRKLIRR